MGIVNLLNSREGESRYVKAIRSKLGVYYASYGRFCARHPWEIIVSFVTLTVCILSMSFISGGKVAIPCGGGDGCQEVPLSLTHDDKVCREGWVQRAPVCSDTLEQFCERHGSVIVLIVSLLNLSPSPSSQLMGWTLLP